MTKEGWTRRAAARRLFAAATAVAAFACVSGPSAREPSAREPSARESSARGPSTPSAAPAAVGAAPTRMSDAGLAHIREREAFMPKPYDDGAGNATIGYGHLIRKGENYSAGITEAQGQTLFRQDVERVVNPALDKITIDLTQNQVDALGSFIFNVGTGGFLRNLLSHVNAGEHQETTSRMLKFITGRDARSGRRRVLRGLLTRRRFEVALYKKPTNLQFLSSALTRQ